MVHEDDVNIVCIEQTLNRIGQGINIRGFPKFSDSIKLIEVMWKMTISSLELSFVLPILYLLYIVSLIPVTVKKFKNYA